MKSYSIKNHQNMDFHGWFLGGRLYLDQVHLSTYELSKMTLLGGLKSDVTVQKAEHASRLVPPKIRHTTPPPVACEDGIVRPLDIMRDFAQKPTILDGAGTKAGVEIGWHPCTDICTWIALDSLGGVKAAIKQQQKELDMGLSPLLDKDYRRAALRRQLIIAVQFGTSQEVVDAFLAIYPKNDVMAVAGDLCLALRKQGQSWAQQRLTELCDPIPVQLSTY